MLFVIFMIRRLLKSRFNGAILVAKNGQVLFEQYKGYSNFYNERHAYRAYTFSYCIHFKNLYRHGGAPAVGRWKASLEDTLQKYFPQLPYHGITIRMLLSHRSGLPNYLYFMDTIWDKQKEMTNQDVLNALIIHHPAIQLPPDRRFEYCNTNFVLLGADNRKNYRAAFS
jgi:hypothetical protein